MKKKTPTLICLFSALFAFSQTGMGTLTPTTKLHVVGTPTLEPLRIEGLKSGSGNYLIVDGSGVVKTSSDISKESFTLPTVSSTKAVNFLYSYESGANTYNEGSGLGTELWWALGVVSDFTIKNVINSLSINAEGMAQYTGDMSDGAWISYAIGVFLDEKLIAVRRFQLDGLGAAWEDNKWNILGQANNLTVGAHKIALYATRRASSASPTANLAIGGPAVGATNLNQFMTKAVMQISGVYN